MPACLEGEDGHRYLGALFGLSIPAEERTTAGPQEKLDLGMSVPEELALGEEGGVIKQKDVGRNMFIGLDGFSQGYSRLARRAIAVTPHLNFGCGRLFRLLNLSFT